MWTSWRESGRILKAVCDALYVRVKGKKRRLEQVSWDTNWLSELLTCAYRTHAWLLLSAAALGFLIP